MPRPLFYQADTAERLECFQAWFILMITGDDDDDDEELSPLLYGLCGVRLFSAWKGRCSTPRKHLTFEKYAHHDMQALYHFDYSGLNRCLCVCIEERCPGRLQQCNEVQDWVLMF